jgi:actin-related protein
MSSSYYSGNNSSSIGAIVADIGAGVTKLGWAGDDYPRSIFRSVRYEWVLCHICWCVDCILTNECSWFWCLSFLVCFVQTISTYRDPKSGRIQRDEFKYDYFTRPILSNGTDGKYETYNPIDMHTGLLYHSYNSNITIEDGDVDMINSNVSSTLKKTAPQTTQSVNTNTPTENTNLPDWYDMVHQFLLHGYNTGLTSKAFTGTPDVVIDQHPMLMIERSYTPPASRQMMTELLFEDLQVPAMFLGKDAVLACYGTGRTSATVVDIGYSGTTVSPVFEGYVESKGIRRNPSASIYAMDEIIISNLDKLYYRKKKQKNAYTVMPLYQVRQKNHKLRKESIHTAARLHLALQCREEGAGVTINTATDTFGLGGSGDTTGSKSSSTATFNAPSKPFELPDGTIIDVPSADRFSVADVIYGTNDSSQQIRDVRFMDIKTKVQNYLSATSTSYNSTASNDENYKRQLAREAVGIVSDNSGNNNSRVKRSRRSGSSEKTASSNANETRGSTRPRKTTMAWQQACHGQIQTLLDEQMTSSSLANMVCDAAYRCDREQQATLLGNVIVCGGGSCIGPTEQAVPDNIRDNVEALIHQHTPGWRVKVLTPAMNERAVLSWIGGSILGSLGTFNEMWITKAEYEEWGSAIVNRKCP